MRERDTVWLRLAGDRRPGVVIEIQPDFVRVAYGTQSPHPTWANVVVVRPDSRQGRKFPLSHVTHFYGANTAWEVRSALERGEGQVSYEVYFAIRRCIEEHDAAL